MKIVNRGKAKYRIGSVALQNTNADNLAVLSKCNQFIQTAFCPEKAHEYVKMNDFRLFSGEFVNRNEFRLFGEPWLLTPPNGQIDIYFDFIDHVIELVGINGVAKTAKMNVGLVVLDMDDYDHTFGQLVHYMLPTYTVTTETKTIGVYDSNLPVTGDLRSIVTTATCTAKKTRTNIKSISYEQKFIPDGRIDRCIRIVEDGKHSEVSVLNLEATRMEDKSYALEADKLVRIDNISMLTHLPDMYTGAASFSNGML